MVEENARAHTSRTTKEREFGRHSMQFNDNSCGRNSGDNVTHSTRQVAAFSGIICSTRFPPAMSFSGNNELRADLKYPQKDSQKYGLPTTRPLVRGSASQSAAQSALQESAKA